MNFRCGDDELLKKYDKIWVWEKVRSSIKKKEFNNSLTYKNSNDNTYIKTKIKIIWNYNKDSFL